MKYRQVPHTDMKLSVVGFGCWAVGGRWWGDDVRDETSIAAIHKALDLGINWFDTAPLYGHGHADEVLVRALGPRLKDVIVATKVGVRWDGEGMHAQSDLAPAYVREDTEKSLKRLGIERIDLLQVHWPCEKQTPLDATLDALVVLQKEGKIRHFGLCNYDPTALSHAIEHAPVATLQTPFSLLRREFEHGLAQVCLAPGGKQGRIGVLAYEPLARGLLTGKFRATPTFPDSDLRARDDRFKGAAFLKTRPFVTMLEQAAQKVGVPAAALAIGWVGSRPGITSVIAGAKRPEQVVENARAAVMVDNAAFWEAIDRVVNAYKF
jgi:aryl-alcohol dehydrogenase-like predicted oxidoreductase